MNRWFRLTSSLLLLLFSSLSPAQQPSSPQPFPTEWIDAQTGHRVVRLSREAGSSSFYFHQNAYTPEGDKLLISTPSGLTAVNLRTRELDLVVPRAAYSSGGSSGVEVGRKTRHVYYSHRDVEGIVMRSMKSFSDNAAGSPASFTHSSTRLAPAL